MNPHVFTHVAAYVADQPNREITDASGVRGVPELTYIAHHPIGSAR